MVESYRQMRMPLQAYLKFIDKQKKVEGKLFAMTNKKIPVPLTKLMMAVADQTIYIDNDYLIKMFAEQKRLKKKQSDINGFNV